MVEFVKTCDQYPHKFTFGHFFSSIICPLSAGKKIDLQKTLFRRNEQFPSELGMMIKTWGRVLLVGMSKNEQIQFFDLQMYLPVILALSI